MFAAFTPHKEPNASQHQEYLVLARVIEPTSKLDALRVLAEAGIAATSYATLKRRLPIHAEPVVGRHGLASVCAKHAALGPASLVLYDWGLPCGLR